MKGKITSIMVPLVITPREVYMGPFGFFFTPMISKLKVHFSSGCVTCAFVKRRPDGRMKRSYFGGFLVKLGPTNVAFVIILFHCLAAKQKPSLKYHEHDSHSDKNPSCVTKKHISKRILTFPFTRSDYPKHLIFSNRSNL